MPILILTLEEPLEEGAERAHAFSSNKISIGRKEQNDLILPVAHISSRHAEIRRVGGRYLFADLGSTNGSMVQRGEESLLLGAKGVPELALQDGDLLVLGDIDTAVRLRVSIGESEEQDQMSAAGINTVVSSRERRETLAISQRVTADHTALRALFRLVQAIDESSERDSILRRVAEAALDAIPGAVDALVVVEQAGDLVVKAEAHRGQGLCRTADAGICKEVLSSDRALLFGEHDASAMPAQTLVSRGVGSGIAAPLWGRERAQGVLQVNCEPNRFELREPHLDLAVVLAHHAATALERAELISRLQAAEQQLRAENSLLRRRAQPAVEMVARSPVMASVLEDLRRAAETDVTVLIQGETGTGKEVAARFLHEHSNRRGGLLVPVNCGALTETLLDSELFGHRKGAFTGASSDRKGVFEVAAGGTVFLDEVGETPLSLQVRLLRVLEESKIKVVGESLEKHVDVRVVAASNKDLAQLVEQGRFRQDLYYRLRVFPVTIPPLRQRPEDLEPLCDLFARRLARRIGKRVGGIDPSLVEAAKRYPFPGNVRELANEIERAIVRVGEGEPLTAELLSEEILAAQPTDAVGAEAMSGATLRERLARFEGEIIAETLARHGGRRAAAAKELGVTRQGLAKKMERLGL